MLSKRASGILVHPTSLPGPFGIGDLGLTAMRWIDWLLEAGCQLWQVLPLGPTGFGDSPYQSFSSFAGNPLMISPDRLIEEGLLSKQDLKPIPDCPLNRVDYGLVIQFKERLLSLCTEQFKQGAPTSVVEEFETFCEEKADWLDDFALFMALKNAHGGLPWVAWEKDLVKRCEKSLLKAKKQYSKEIEDQRIRQFLFSRQWSRLRNYANTSGIVVIGDIPIFVSHDSADVWANQHLFQLDETGEPVVVAGVPPDYFSPTGQRWGNPLYRWDVLEADGFRWWINRFKAILEMVDYVRLDHFRGFEAYWEIPAESPTAGNGKWVSGPGVSFFETLKKGLGDLPIIAEDLGFITPEVKALRDRFNLPGMKILQFAIKGGTEDEFIPYNYTRNCVAYTGTHDNNTSKGWFESASEEELEFFQHYLPTDGSDIAWDLIQAVWASVASWAITPLQDVLGLGSEARMNLPGTIEGNWSWRVTEDQLAPELASRLYDFNEIYGRLTA
jgi:4-alpha-glucanotransferase